MIEGISGTKLIKPVLYKAARNLCQRPYLGHPNGCPNFSKHPSCPPRAPMLEEIFDLSKPVWAVYVEYDLESQRNRMWMKHPKWSKRQAECCLYWQKRVLSFLKSRVANFCTSGFLYGTSNELTALYRPEACGVDVTKTMANAGVEIPWPPETNVYKIAFVGHSKT